MVMSSLQSVRRSVVRALSLVVVVCSVGACGIIPGMDRAPWEHPRLVFRPADDSELRAAAATAISKFNVFADSFYSKAPDAKARYMVKIQLAEDGKTETFWLLVSAIDGNKITGTLDSNGANVRSARKGDVMTVNVAEIKDWFINDDDSYRGGYSMLVLEKDHINWLSGFDFASQDANSAKKRALLEHWQQVVARVKSNQPADLYANDTQVLSEVLMLERICQGNSGHVQSYEELAAVTGLPVDLVKAMKEFYALRPRSVQTSF